jgi:hypothetical protein
VLLSVGGGEGEDVGGEVDCENNIIFSWCFIFGLFEIIK